MTDARHIGYIDGLRGVAVLLVVFAHVAFRTGAEGALAHVAKEGAHGVDLFFVISGFCLAYPTLAKFGSGRRLEFDLAGFAGKRLVRIAPPYYLAVAALLAISLLAVALHREPLVESPGAFQLAAQLAFLDRNVDLLNPSFWTLMVEFRWYFIFPIVLFVWLKSPRAFAAIAAASAVLYAVTRARGLDLGTLPGFMLGIVAADVFVGARLPLAAAGVLKRYAVPAMVLFAVIGVALESHATLPASNGNEYAFAFQPTILGWQLATFFAVVAAGASAWARALFAQGWIAGTGVASYSIYLVHEPIVAYVVHKVPGAAGNVAAVLGCVAAGIAFWAILERPFTTGSLRMPLLRAVAPAIRRGFALTGIPPRVTLPSAPGAALPLGVSLREGGLRADRAAQRL